MASRARSKLPRLGAEEAKAGKGGKGVEGGGLALRMARRDLHTTRLIRRASAGEKTERGLPEGISDTSAP